MTKIIKSSIIISCIVNVILLIINYLCALLFDKLPLSISFAGGDCTEYIGFGIHMLKVFPLSNNGTTSTSISFDAVSLLISLVIIFVLVLLFKIIFKNKTA